MKVSIQLDDHHLGKSTKALTNQGDTTDDITFITFIVFSALNPPYLLLHLILILMMAVKVTLFIITHQQ